MTVLTNNMLKVDINNAQTTDINNVLKVDTNNVKVVVTNNVLKADTNNVKVVDTNNVKVADTTIIEADIKIIEAADTIRTTNTVRKNSLNIKIF